MQANDYDVSQWPLPEWDPDSLTLAAIYFNPDMRLAFAQLQVRQAEVQTAAQRINPNVSIPLEYHSDTSGGISPWLTGLVPDFVYERKAKRLARINHARAQIETARIGLEETGWQLRSRLRVAFIDYYAALRHRDLLRIELQLMEKIVKLLLRRQELGQASSFEVSTARLEMQQLKVRLADQGLSINDSLYALIRSTGLPADRFGEMSFSFSEMELLPRAEDLSMPSIRNIALKKRFDVRRALSEYTASEEALKLEIEKQYPDITLSPGFVFDQSDKIWSLGSAWILPLFHNNQGPIQEALAKRELQRLQFLKLQTAIINDLGMYRNRYLKLLGSLRDSGDLVAQMEERAAQAKKRFELGYSDRIEWMRSNLELLRLKRASFDIRVEAIRTLQKLENVLQYPLRTGFDIQDILEELFVNKPASS